VSATRSHSTSSLEGAVDLVAHVFAGGDLRGKRLVRSAALHRVLPTLLVRFTPPAVTLAGRPIAKDLLADPCRALSRRLRCVSIAIRTESEKVRV
jgi:hypothetical protein